MSNTDKVITIKILDKELQIKCPEEKIDDLQKAAYHLDNTMREIKDQGKAIGHEKIAQLAGIHIAYELIVTQKQKDLYLDSIGNKIQELHLKISDAISEGS